MTVAARSFGRRPRADQGGVTPAASLGAVLELLRALNWMIRADMPWPTKRDQNFDFVLVGEPGVFAMWVHDGEPEGLEEAAAGLSALLDGVRVRPVVCRAAASLTHAHPEVLYCTPETALDLLIGLPAHENPAELRAIAMHLRDLEVPIPPEPEPPSVVVIEPPKVAAPKVEAAKASAPKAAAPVIKVAPPSKPTPSAKPVPAPVVHRPAAPMPPKPAVAAKPEAPIAPKPKPEPTAQPTAVPIQVPQPKPASAPVVAPPVAPAPEPARPLPAGRHRSDRPRRVRRPAPPPPPERASAESRLPKSTLALPTAIVPPQVRTRGGNDAAQRFDNDYVFVPEPIEGPGALRREFRAKPFLMGIVALIVIVLAAGLGVRAWPQVAGLVQSNPSPSAAFGQTITAGGTNFHPRLRLSATLPQLVAASRGAASYSVDLSVSNVGSTSWELPPRSAFVMLDSLGESHALTSISGVAGSRWSGSLKPTQSWSGRLVFTLKAGRAPLRMRFALAANGSETATWNHA